MLSNTFNLMILVHASKFTFTSGQATKKKAENDIKVLHEISRHMVFFHDCKYASKTKHNVCA